MGGAERAAGRVVRATHLSREEGKGREGIARKEARKARGMRRREKRPGF